MQDFKTYLFVAPVLSLWCKFLAGLFIEINFLRC